MESTWVPTRVKDWAEALHNHPPAAIILLFIIIYGLEILVPGSFYAISSALIGAGLLYLFQMREDLWPSLIRRFRGSDTANAVVATQNERQDPQTTLESSPAPVTLTGDAGIHQEESEDDGSGFSLDGNWLQRGGGEETSAQLALADSEAVDHDQQQQALICQEQYGCTGVNSDVVVLEEERPDPVNKARLDLLFRYLASMDARNGEQGTPTPQRQKLQRKLLQRTAGEETGIVKPSKTKKGTASECIADGSPTAEQVDNVLEDASKIEALLRELGESDGTPQPKVQGPSKRARRKGSGMSCPKSPQEQRKSLQMQPVVEPAVEVVRDVKKAERTRAEQPAQDVHVPSLPSGTSVASSGGCARRVLLEDSFAEAADEEAVEDDAEEPLGFQVVANRKARRKSRKEAVLEQSPTNSLTGDPLVTPVPRADSASESPSQKTPAVRSQDNCHRSDELASVPAATKPVQATPQKTTQGWFWDPPPAKATGIPSPVEQDATIAEVGADGNRSAADIEAIAGAIANVKEPACASAVTGTCETAMEAQTTSAGTSGTASGASGEAEDGCREEDQAEERVRDPNEATELRGEQQEWEDDEDWEWQCPDGYQLQKHVCSRPMLCSSCGEMQPEGASVLRAEESGWAACEDCIRIAWGQPVEPRWEEPSEEAAETIDPSRMSALEIATWFQERGAETALKQCMLQVLAGEPASSALPSDQEKALVDTDANVSLSET